MSYNEPTETLTSTDIWSVGKANQKFGEDKSLLIARPGKKIWRFPSFWFTIPEGFYALVTRHGALEYTKDRNGNKTPLWPAGFHYGPPWLKVSHLVTKQAVVFNTPVRGCRTKDNVRVDVGKSSFENMNRKHFAKLIKQIHSLPLTRCCDRFTNNGRGRPRKCS